MRTVDTQQSHGELAECGCGYSPRSSYASSRRRRARRDSGPLESVSISPRWRRLGLLFEALMVAAYAVRTTIRTTPTTVGPPDGVGRSRLAVARTAVPRHVSGH